MSADSFRLVDTKVAEELVGGLVHADDLARVEGWVAANTVAAGDLVTRRDLRPASAPDALRAVSLPIDRERAAGGYLASGDRVDVIAVIDGRARYVGADLEVLAVAADGEGALAGPARFFVTVAVDEGTGLALAQALEAGAVSVLRSTGSAPATVDREALEELSGGSPRLHNRADEDGAAPADEESDEEAGGGGR